MGWAVGRCRVLGGPCVVADLPIEVEAELLRRWREPHRRYHGESHLRHGLGVLAFLGAGRPERVAFWFHDAVHRSSSPSDEEASALLAGSLLDGVFPASEREEVIRLVLVTIDHDPGPDDLAGGRISDADLAALASPWGAYLANAQRVRSESPGLDGAAWQARRLDFIDRLVGRAAIFRTPKGVALWEAAARRNLALERDTITNRPGSGTSGA